MEAHNRRIGDNIEIDFHRKRLRRVAYVFYGLMRIPIPFLTLFFMVGVFACLYWAKPIPEVLVWSYITTLVMYEAIKILKRLTHKSCGVAICELDKQEEIEKEKEDTNPLTVRISFMIWKYPGLNKFIFFVWFFVFFVIMLYSIGSLCLGNDPYIPENFLALFIGVTAVCLVGILDNALFIFKMPVVQKFFARAAGAALRDGKKGVVKEVAKIVEDTGRELSEAGVDEAEKCTQCGHACANKVINEFDITPKKEGNDSER